MVVGAAIAGADAPASGKDTGSDCAEREIVTIDNLYVTNASYDGTCCLCH